ncbi:MAG: efflux RND transporter permease subunit [Spirochaeta sp.]|jgi:HAE1 family hydrophobic/amphiphilic exporter-1|nr:efflux RND transporter permease subunit [Spirochaeta sp.]
MILSDFAVRHPVIISILVVVLLVFGALAFFNLNREMMPPVGLPQAHVITTWPGAGAEDVEEAITRRIENQLSTLGGMSTMTSTSEDSYSIVQLEFTDGTDVYGRLPEIRELLNVVGPELPDGIDGQPEILMSEANSLLPVFSFQVDSIADPVELARFLDDEMAPRLARIPGVARINVVGETEEEVRVTLDPDRARARGIPPVTVFNALQMANTNLPAGEAQFRGRELPLTTEGAFTGLADVRNLVVGHHENAYVRLGDVARVELRPADPTVTIRSGGENTVVVDVLKRDDGNTIEIVNEAHIVLDRIAADHPGTFTWRTVSDHRDMTNRSIQTVITSAVVGTILATLMILLFLHDIRATAIIAVSIPLSVLFAFGGMYLSGRTINLLTLSGITVAIGMIVDASVVTLENTWKHYHAHGDRKLAARRGAGEVGSAILASTLTSVSVFAPLAFLAGVIGIIMTDLSLTIVYSLVAAAIVAVVVVPFLSSIMLKPEHSPRKHRLSGTVDRRLDAAFERFRGMYRRTLERALNDSRFVLLIAAAILVVSVLMVTTLPVSFLPPTDTGEFEIHIETPRTYSLSRTERVVDEIDRIVAQLIPETEAAVYYVGAASSLVIAGAPNEAYGRIRLVKRADRDRAVQELIPLVQHELDRLVPEADITVLNGGFDALLGLATGGQGYQLEIYGTRLEEVVQVADLAYEHLAGDPNVLKAETNTTFDAEQLFFTLSQDRMGDLGVSAYEAGLTARILMNGVTAGSYTAGAERVPIRLVSELADAPVESDTLHAMSLRNSDGTTLTFAAFSDLVPRRTVSTINKRDRAISATVRGYLYDEDQSGVSLRMETMMQSLDLPPGIGWERAGTSELIVDSMRSLLTMLAIAIFLVYAVMVIQFERYLQPLIIMVAVPFCLIGVVMGLLLFSSALSIVAMLGLITLGGTVVNNAIVMVDYMNMLRTRDGFELREAIVEGASGRLRPVLMTTMTTLFAVLPMALSVGDGSEIYAPLGQAIFGGLFTSTVITLFVVPVLYQVSENRHRRGRSGKGPPGSSSARAVLIAASVLAAGSSPLPAQTTVNTLQNSAFQHSVELEALFAFDEPFAPLAPDVPAATPRLSPVGSRENHDIALREAELDAARADHAGAVARRFPTVSAIVDAAWLANPSDPVTLEPGELGTIPLSQIDPRVQNTQLPEEETELFPGSGMSRYELGLSVVQPIFAWRTIENAINAAAAAERVAATRLAGTRHAVRVEIAATRELITILDAITGTLEVREAAAERLVTISRENWTNGFITETEYRDARLARQEVRLAATEVTERRGNAAELLRLLTGNGEIADDLDGTRPPAAEQLTVSADELVSRAANGSWELHALKEAERFRHSRERIAAGSRPLRPEIGVRADLSWVGALEDAGAAAWEDRGDWQVTIGVGVSATLFDGGRAAASHSRSEAEVSRAAIERRHQEDRIAVAVREQIRRIETLRARMEHTVVKLSVLEREIADARTAFDAGAGGEETVLRAVIDHSSTTAEGYDHLAAYRSALWSVTGILGAEAF